MNAWLLCCLLTCLLPGTAPTAGPGSDHETILVRTESGPFTTLHYGGEVRVPYLWPVIGPGGTEMTRAFPMEAGRPGEAEDHPHHTSFWFAHGDVNGEDFWHSKGQTPRIDVVGRPAVSTSADATTIDSVHAWISTGGEALLRETRRMAFGEQDGVRHIDVDIRLEACVDVRFGDTKEGTFALRLHPALRLTGEIANGHALNSEGKVDGELWGKRCRWLTYFGVVDEHEVGVAVFDHVENLRHPTWWHARDYGLVAANPFGIHDFERKPAGTGDHALAKGEVLRLRYRVLLYEGRLDEPTLARRWRSWSAPDAQVPSGAAADGAKGETDRSSGRDS